MVKTQEEDIEFEVLKQNHKLDLLKAQEEVAVKEHKRKLERLDKQLEIARFSGYGEKEDNNDDK